MNQLDNILRDTCNRLIQRWAEQQEEDRKAVEEFRAMDMVRLGYDKEYQRQLDERFGEGWIERVKLVIR